ncbi:hypothetical protein Zm00014a_022526 [Zea mays]|uniref:Uncharacterized protein n=1 Tax=Zea mays TaxID=4577 RepID=A0A3L6D9P7_MAIZE|nr:hypothetical protein Zm00014a_022526 [Zea mays]
MAGRYKLSAIITKNN